MASFDNASFDIASFNEASFFMNAGGFVFVPTEFPLFFNTTIKTPEVGFQTSIVDEFGGSVTIKDTIAARVSLK